MIVIFRDIRESFLFDRKWRHMLNLLNAYYVAGLEIPKKCLLVPFVICALWLVNCKVLKKDQKAREEQNFTFSAFIRDVHDFKIEKKERDMKF